MTQIIVNSAKFTTALNATKTQHRSSHLLQKNLDAIFKKKVDHFLEDDHLTIHRSHTLQTLYIMFKIYIYKYFANLLIVKFLFQPNFSSANTTAACTYTCTLHCSSLVSVGPYKCSSVWHTLKHGLAHNPTFHFGHANFLLLFSAQQTCTKFSSLPNSRGHCIIHLIISVGSRMGLASFVAWSEAKAFFLLLVLGSSPLSVW